MVATPFKTFTKVHIIQQPIHLTLSQKYRKRLFLLGPPSLSTNGSTATLPLLKGIYSMSGQNSALVYRIRSKSFVHQGSNPFTNKFRIYIRWSQVSQHFFSKPLQFKNIRPIVLNRTFGIVPLMQKIVKKRICQQHIATYLKSCNECMKKVPIIRRNLRILNLPTC